MKSLIYRLVWLLLGALYPGEIHAGRSGKSSLLDETLLEKDLLSAVQIPFQDNTYQYFETGSDGFPAMGIRPGSDIKAPYRLFFPEKFYPEFSIAFTLKLADPVGGFLFAVTTPLDNVVELGVLIKGLGPHLSNVSLLYTSSTMYISDTLASFIIPTSFTSWTTVGLSIKEDRVDISLNCAHHEGVHVVKNPQELDFDSASTLYIGQAGPIIHGALHLKHYREDGDIEWSLMGPGPFVNQFELPPKLEKPHRVFGVPWVWFKDLESYILYNHVVETVSTIRCH